MTFPKKTAMIIAAALAAILGGALAGGQQPAIAGSTQNGSEMPLAESKLIIEHNAKDKYTGFQGFIDSEEGLKTVTVTDPTGNKVLGL